MAKRSEVEAALKRLAPRIPSHEFMAVAAVGEDAAVVREQANRTRERMRESLRAARLDDRTVEIEVRPQVTVGGEAGQSGSTGIGLNYNYDY